MELKSWFQAEKLENSAELNYNHFVNQYGETFPYLSDIIQWYLVYQSAYIELKKLDSNQKKLEISVKPNYYRIATKDFRIS